MYLIAAAFIIFLPGYLYFRRSTRVLYIKKLILPVGCIVFVLLLIFYSRTAVAAALNGLNLWLNIVVPSLFPFFIASELLKKSGFIKSAGILLEPVMRPLFNIPGAGSFAFLMGITSGYPVGAKITADLYCENLLTRDEAERLLAFSNNSGPLFIIGAVSVGMFKIPVLGLIFLTCHIAAGITVGMLYRFFNNKSSKSKKYYNPGINTFTTGNKKSIFSRFKKELKKQKSSNLGSLLGSAITNSVQTILMVGGFIIFFSVLINLLLETGIITSISDILAIFLTPVGVNKDLINAVLSGLFEITTGTRLASNLANTTFTFRLMATSFIIGWAGLSVHAQVLSIVSEKGLSIKPYLFGKLLQGCFAAFYTIVLYKSAGPLFIGSKDILPGSKGVFSQTVQSTSSGWHGALVFSLAALSVLFTFYLILLFSGRSMKNRPPKGYR